MSETADMIRADDGELWQRARQGEAECFGVLFDRHGGAIRAFCARRTGSIDAADDLVSIVFLEAWRRRGEVELVDGNALPWLYGIARRTIQHRWRTAVRHRRALERLAPASATPDHAEEVAGRLDDERHLTRLRAALERLRPPDRDVLLLCVWQGLTYAEAAVALGVPVGTVRSRLSRARSRLDAETESLTIVDPATCPVDTPTQRQEMS
ncbi:MULTISPECIES: RNA polymerase sigma factor [unclassified Micromonospora]|uniref:RNA polymerase sigma factor n=1 Tax=unclassified Micromonospora TaxID=2617518 RepID=UPI0022B62908|nr:MULTISPECIES: RNA polymerase sigma factor [unclassified Micromonospora]MCZ7421210.1 RNA polymerase sigma factor [Verrucosispora sp. WMMA2121]WBB94091.1 RNA polymerase sigma factor [Verrucosispora sp. WMMC514]